MEDEEIYSKEALENFSYRYLQQIAKTLCLPCNVKKIYLIELIRAKKFCSESEVEDIVYRVKMERQHMAQIRKTYTKAKQKEPKIYEKTHSSPPITVTPKRTGTQLRCSPDLKRAIIPKKPKHSINQTNTLTHKTDSLNIHSDRVLRSSNTSKKLNRKSGIVNLNDTAFEEKKRVSPKETRIEIVSREVTAKCRIKKHKHDILCTSMSNSLGNENQQLPVSYRATSSIPKKHRTISGIYPLIPEEPPTKYSCLQSIELRGRDGKMSKIQALVQKRSIKENFDIINFRKPNINFRNIINYKIDTPMANPNIMELVIADTNSNNNYLHKQNQKFEEKDTDNNLEESNTQNCKELVDMHSLYYRKKIRAEKVTCNGFNKDEVVKDDTLPRINDTFTRFKNVTQPLYVQVSSESERINSHPVYAPRNNSEHIQLENIYNFKSQFLINQPLSQLATVANTKCVYSTPVIATAMAHSTSAVALNGRCASSVDTADSEYRNDNGEGHRASDYSRFAYEDTHRYVYNEEHSISTSSLDTPQPPGLGACVTIPEMVEDALEIISQDGDYMERIGMDVRVQCVICSWAGPKFLLENHIRKDHTNQIYKQQKSECNITFTLASLVQCQLWISHIVEYDSTLFILSIKYEDPDCFMASLSALTTEPTIDRIGSITIYNKVTGEPYSWEGVIQPLPSNLPYDNDTYCLKLELSKLNLLPNSANLKLLNRELVNNSPNKVVVGQPELSDIHIILFIKISN